MTLLRENPSLVRPMNRLPHSSGILIMSPVSRTRNSWVGASYMSPLLHVTRGHLGKVPRRIRRASRSFTSGDSLNCSLLSASWAYAAVSTRSPAPTRMVKYGPWYSFQCTNFRCGGSSEDSPAEIVFSSVAGGAGLGDGCGAGVGLGEACGEDIAGATNSASAASSRKGAFVIRLPCAH